MEELTGNKTSDKKEYTQQDFANEFQELVERLGWTVGISQQSEQTVDGGIITIAKLVVIKVQK